MCLWREHDMTSWKKSGKIPSHADRAWRNWTVSHSAEEGPISVVGFGCYLNDPV